VAKAKRQAGSKKGQPQKPFWQSLLAIVRRLWFVPPLPEAVVHSEEDLYHADMLGISSKKLRLLREKRRLHERIAQGNALAEVESHDRRLRQGKV